MATDRINKYFDDAKTLIAFGNIPKILAEVKKLSSYLQKHQTETVPEGAKTKLFGAVDAFYRYGCNNLGNESLVDCISTLIGTYLQLPEGKLVTASNKKKALTWLQEFNVASNSSLGSDLKIPMKDPTSWSIESINEDGTVTLLSTKNSELWKEDYVPANLSEHMTNILNLQNDHDSVIIELDEETDMIVGVQVN